MFYFFEIKSIGNIIYNVCIIKNNYIRGNIKGKICALLMFIYDNIRRYNEGLDVFNERWDY